MNVLLKKLFLFFLIFALLMATGCTGAQTTPGEKTAAAERIQVITTLFPLYDFSRTLLADQGEVTLLLPPGVESHAFDPTPQDIVRINKADVFIYAGEAMEPWAHQIIDSIDNKELVIIDASTGIELMKHDEGEEGLDAGAEEDHEEGEFDPHIWLDPVLAAQMTDTIAQGLTAAAPELSADIATRQTSLKAGLDALHQKYVATFKKTQYNTIIYGGHFAFGYLAKRYGLEHLSPYDGFSPDAEPTPTSIAQLIDTLKASGTKVIYYEELINPRVAKVIAKETGAEMLLLHGAHNLTKDELDKGITYIQIMEQNLENLKKGLGYHE